MTLTELAYDVRSYNFSCVNGSDVSANLTTSGAGKVLTFVRLPYGLTVGNKLRLSGGTGTAENATITALGGTEGSIGTATVTTVNSHTGLWSAGSASGGIQEAMVACRTDSVLRIVAASTTIYTTVNTPAGKNIMLDGCSSGINVIYRDSSFTAGDMFLNNVVSTLTFRAIGIEQGLFTQTGAAIHGEVCSSGYIALYDVQISNGQYGVIIEACQFLGSGIRINNSAPSGYKPFAGIYFKSNLNVTENTTNIKLSDLNINSYPRGDANQLEYGIYSDGSDGVEIENVSICADSAIVFAPTSSYVVNWQIIGFACDGPTHVGIKTTGTGMISGIVIDGGYINGPTSTTGGPSATNNITFSLGGRLIAFKLSNFRILGCVYGAIAVGSTSTEVSQIELANITCYEGNTADNSDQWALTLLDGSAGVCVSNFRVYNTAGAGKFKYAIVLAGALTDCIIDGVSSNLAGDLTSKQAVFYVPSSVFTNILISNVLDAASATYNTIASGTSVNLGAAVLPAYKITGTTTITTMVGSWRNRSVTLFKTDAGSVTVGGGGNIPAAHTLAQNTSITLVSDGTNWY